MCLIIFFFLLEAMIFTTLRATAVVDRGRSQMFQQSATVQASPDCQHNRERALENYRNGKAHMLMYGITHGASTTVRRTAEQNGLVEATGDRDHPFAGQPDSQVVHIWGESMKSGRNGPLPHSPLHEVMPCNSDNFVSLITMRHPISRILSWDSPTHRVTATQNHDTCPTDNFALRWITGTKPWTNINETDIALAKERIDMFDIVLIVEEFDETSRMLCEELQWKKCQIQYKDKDGPPEGRLPADVYQKFMQRNQPELEVYEYARAKAHTLLQQLPLKRNLMRRIPPLHVDDRATYVDDEIENQHESWVCDEKLNPYIHRKFL